METKFGGYKHQLSICIYFVYIVFWVIRDRSSKKLRFDLLLLLGYFPYFEKNKSRLMGSPFCLCVYPPYQRLNA
jgi:hypothetical protein